MSLDFTGGSTAGREGDDWEHEEIFTDDNKVVGNDPEEREDLAPEVPAPPEIKQEPDDNMIISPVLAPKKKDAPKEEPIDTPAKAMPSGSTGVTLSTTSKSTKSKREASRDDGKVANAASSKKVKTENVSSCVCLRQGSVDSSFVAAPESKSSAKERSAWATSSSKRPTDPSTDPVTEEEIRAVFVQSARVTTHDLVAKFKARLKSKEEKDAFAAILRRISKIQKYNGAKYVESESSAKEGSALASKGNSVITSRGLATSSSGPPTDPCTGPVTEEEIRAVLVQSARVTTQDLVAKFKARLKSKEDKDAFTAILKRISKILKHNGAKYVVLGDKYSFCLHESKSSAKEGSASASKSNNANTSRGQATSSSRAPTDPCIGPVTEEEIGAFLVQSALVTTQDLVANFKARLKSKEEKDAFAAILRRISHIRKYNGANYVVLRDK